MLNTGFEVLDNVLGDIKRQEVIIFTGYRNVGKTTFVINIINNIAKQTDGKILYFYTSKSKLDKSLLEKITMSNVEIINDPNITTEKIREKCKEEIKNNLILVVIDPAQYLDISITIKEFLNQSYHTTPDIIKTETYIANLLNNISTDLNIPVIGVYELHRHRITKAAEEDINIYDYKKVLNLEFDKYLPILHNSNKRIFLHRDDRYKENNMFTGNINIKEVSVINDNILVNLNKE